MSGTPRTAKLLLVALLTVTAILYLLTVNPTVPGGDGGDFVSTAYRLGVAHPPGYPLYTLLAHPFTYLPFGTVAWQVNLASAVFGAAACAFIFLTLRDWLADAWGALLGASLFAFSTSVWRYSVVAEAFALNNLLAALLFYLSLRWWRSRETRSLYALAFVVGLAAAHHHTLLLAAAPVGVLILARDSREVLRPRTAGWSLASFAAGLLPYAYLPWASSRRLAVSWGDQTTFDGFWTHVLRREYGTFQLVGDETGASLGTNLGYYFADAAHDLLYVGLALAVAGAVLALRREPRWHGFPFTLLASWLCYTLVFAWLSNLDLSHELAREAQSRFWQLSNLPLCMFAAAGLVYGARWIGRGRKWLAPALALALCATQIGANYNRADSSNDRTVEQFVRATLDSLPDDAVLLARGDARTHGLRYLQECLGHRPDIVIIPVNLLGTGWLHDLVREHHPEIRFPSPDRLRGAPPLNAFLDANSDREVFITTNLYAPEERALEGHYDLWNLGFTHRVVEAGRAPSLEEYLALSETYREYEPPSADELRHRGWARFLIGRYWVNEQERAERLSLYPVDTEEGAAFVLQSAEALERLLRLRPDPPLVNHRTLAFAYHKLGGIDPKYRRRMAEVLRHYLTLNPNDPDRERIEALIRSAVVG